MSEVSILTVLLFIASIGRNISRPLAELKEVGGCINTGDLTASDDINLDDEIGQLTEAINEENCADS